MAAEVKTGKQLLMVSGAALLEYGLVCVLPEGADYGLAAVFAFAHMFMLRAKPGKQALKAWGCGASSALAGFALLLAWQMLSGRGRFEPGTVLVQGLVSAAWEESLFRGLFLPAVEVAMPWPVLISAGAFALAHGMRNLMTGFLSGVVLGLMYADTGKIWMPLGYHMGWNLLAGLLPGLEARPAQEWTVLILTGLIMAVRLYRKGKLCGK